MRATTSIAIAITVSGLFAGPALAQSSPGFSLQRQAQSANISELGGAPGGALEGCATEIGKYCVGKEGGAKKCLSEISDKLSGECKTTLAAPPPPPPKEKNPVPRCAHSPLCSTTRGGGKPMVDRVVWDQAGYTFAYPFALPKEAKGGVSGVAVDSHDNLWAFERNAPGQPQLFEFDRGHKLIRIVGPDVINYIFKAHGIAVDAQDNVWICDADGSVVMKLSPEGKLLMTIGTRARRGDWDEAKGQRLLWQPMDVGFGPKGDVYISEGHADESPNDVNTDDPANVVGAARILHFDKNGKFVNQWYGNSWGPGKFTMAHGMGVDPRNGDVWIGDREQYRLVVYSGEGKFIKTVSMKNLTCAVYFDRHGNLWVATGNDGQLINIDRDGKVLAAIGKGRGTGDGQFMETNFMGQDSAGNMYSGDTTMNRVTQMVAPKH
jgi:sugar lactone lactonase YvrE